jgi:membrane protease YdiL (CAAX protease family)
LNLGNVAKRHPLAVYFVATFSVSWTLAFLVVAQYLIRAQQIPYFSGIIMFPAMLVGPFATGIIMTSIVDGRDGRKELFARIRRWRIGTWVIPALVIPPALMLLVLLPLEAFYTKVFNPNFFIYGIGFGVIAGALEEVGWTGYAIRKLTQQYSALTSAVILGVLWGIWHAPVVDFLGAAYPHGAFWLPFLLAFIAIVSALRVLIVWVYTNTGSVFAAQVMHASFTGFIAVLAPVAVLPSQEAGWYALYALTLWIAVLLVAKAYGYGLDRNP